MSIDQCSIGECPRSPRTLGWCNAHYQRWLRWGNPRAGRPIFDAYVEITDACWLWRGALTHDGYGRFRPGGPGRRAAMAHRWLYELCVSPVPEGLQLDHLCRVRHCVNPDHLEPVTSRENKLRGIIVFSKRALKTHCPKGHPYSGTNVRYTPDGKSRYCLQCKREKAYVRMKQRRAQATALIPSSPQNRLP